MKVVKATQEELQEEIRQINNRLAAMEKLFEMQGAINGKLLENMNHLLLQVAQIDTQPKSALILPERLNG